jgi:hypothetical protein
MNDNTKKQPLDEPGRMISKFQQFIANEGLLSQIIDSFPYPMVVFTPQYTLIMVNKAFETVTQMQFMNLEEEPARIFRHMIDDARLASAVKRVFAGDTFFFEELKNPFSMFSGIKQPDAPQTGSFNKAVIFPVPAENTKIIHGVIVFMP